MRNMMLQVKNSNRSHRPQVGLTALAVSLLTALAVCFASCDKKNDPVQPASGTSSDRPAWVVPDSYDMTSSMTAIVKVNVAAANENDLLAAFSGEDCVGVTQPQSGLCFLFISGPAESIQLRFYSGEQKKIYTAKQTFPFVNDTQLGTVSKPYTPEW